MSSTTDTISGKVVVNCGKRKMTSGSTLLQNLNVKEIIMYICRFGNLGHRRGYYAANDRADLCKVFREIPGTKQYIKDRTSYKSYTEFSDELFKLKLKISHN